MSPRKRAASGKHTTISRKPSAAPRSAGAFSATAENYIIGHGGGAASQHTYCTAISWADALPGDLVFYLDDTHVGIVAGWDENGNILIIHCASGYNNVVITGKEGFSSIGRPADFA